MGILSRYIIFEILKLLFPLWFAFGFLVFIAEWVSKIFSIRAPLGVTLELYIFKFPAFLQLVFPVAVLFSCLAVFGAMNRNREVVAVQSVGVQNRVLWLSALFAIFLGSIPYLWITTDLAPWAMKKHYELYDTEVSHVPSRFSQVRNEKQWFRNQDVLYNIRFFAPEKNELYEVTLYTFDEDFQIAQIIYANKASWNGSNWILYDGAVSLSDRRLEYPLLQKFKSRSTALIEDPRKLRIFDVNADSMTQKELAQAIKRQRELGINTLRWEVAYQSRYSFILISFVFLFLAFPRALRFRRGSGAARDGVFVATVCLLYWLLFNMGINLGNSGRLSPWVAVWAPSVLFLVGVFFYNKSRNLKTESE